MIDYRVLVDWDRDRWFNRGVGATTPPNLFPNAIYANPHFVSIRSDGFSDGYLAGGVNNVTNAPIEVVNEPTEWGYSYLRFRGNGSNTLYRRVGITDWFRHQYTFNDWFNPTFVAGVDPCIPNAQDANSFELVTAINNLSAGITPDRYANGGTGAFTNRKAYYAGFLKSNEATRVTYRKDVGYDGLTYPGIVSVTPGETYRFYISLFTIDYHETNPSFLSSEVDAWIVRLRDQNGTLIYNATQTSGNPFPTQWTNSFEHAYPFNFTVPEGVTRISIQIDMRIGGIAGDSGYWTGYVMPPIVKQWPEAEHSSLTHDPGITFDGTQFPVVLEPGKSYNYSFYIRPNGFNWGALSEANRRIRAVRCKIGGVEYKPVGTTHVIMGDGEWQRISFVIPAEAYYSGLYVFFNLPTNTSHTVDVAGFQITEGETLYPFSLGGQGLDDITPYVKTLSWKIGKNNFNDPMAFEGTLDITLNNETKLFSPGNTTSPLHGKLDQNLRVMVEVRKPDGTWFTAWCGWTRSFEVAPGEYNTLEAVVRCEQGLSNLRNGRLTFRRDEQRNSALVLRDMVEDSGWQTVRDTNHATAGWQTLVGVNAVLRDPESLWAERDEGRLTIDFSGLDWGDKTTIAEAIKTLLEAEGGHLWINREGLLLFANRERFINRMERFDADITFGEFVTGGMYQYGVDVVNTVKVTLQTKADGADGVVWKTKRPVRVSPNHVRDIGVNFEFESGRPKTITEVDPKPDITVYTSDPGRLNTIATIMSDREVRDYITVQVLRDGTNRHTVRVINSSTSVIWIAITLHGKAILVGDGEIYTFSDVEAIKDFNTYLEEAFDNKLIAEPEQAASLANTVLYRRARPQGEFTDFTLFVTDQNVDLFQTLSVSKVVLISDTQTGEMRVPHVILEESVKVSSSRNISVTYSLARLDTRRYLKVGDNIEPKYENIINEAAATPRFDGEYTRVTEQVHEYYTGLYGDGLVIGNEVTNLTYRDLNPTGWSGSKYGTAPRIGDYAININTTPKKVNPDRRYKASAWMYRVSGTDASVYMLVRFLPNVGTSLLPLWDEVTTAFFGYVNTSPAPDLDLMTGEFYVLPGVSSVRFVGDETYGANNRTRISHFSYMQYSSVSPVLDEAKTYTYSVWARPKPGWAAKNYTLEVFDEAGISLGTATGDFSSPSATPQQLSVTFTGAKSAWAFLQYSSPLTPHRLWVYGYDLVRGATPSADYNLVLNPSFQYLFP